jgi:predicted RNase H-like HicB family nuclease
VSAFIRSAVELCLIARERREIDSRLVRAYQGEAILAGRTESRGLASEFVGLEASGARSDKLAAEIMVAQKVAMETDPRYEVIIYWSAEDEAFIAEVPELPGCAADGPTYEKALANVQGIVAEWIETAKELGRAVPEPRGRLMFA